MKMLFSSIRQFVRHLNTPSLKHEQISVCHSELSFVQDGKYFISIETFVLAGCGRLRTNLRANNFQMFLSQNCPSGKFISLLNPLARPFYISFNATTMILKPVTGV